jgi:hypothetical protein
MCLLLILSFAVNGGPALYETRFFLAGMSGLLLIYTAYDPATFFPTLA